VSEDVVAAEREELAPVRAALVVERDRERTFEVFVGRLGAWWPTRGHSMGEERVVDIRMDRYAGGQVVEVWDDDSEHPWGTVLDWRPPEGFTLAWQVHSGGRSTEVTVRFRESGPASTVVEVEHRGWASLGDDAAEVREGYRTGWPLVLAAFRDAG
jgi:hypothetical protein